MAVPREHFGVQHEVIFGVRPRARWVPPAVCTRCSGAHDLDECKWPLVPEVAR